MPSPANQPFHDLVRRNEKSPHTAPVIPKLDLIFDLSEGSSKQLSQFVPQRLPIPISGTPKTQMPQDRRPVSAPSHMTKLEIRHVWPSNPQLLGQVSQNIGMDITRPGGKSRPFSEKAQLKRKPDPTRTIDLFDQSDVIKRQAPNFGKRPFQFAVPPPKPETANCGQS